MYTHKPRTIAAIAADLEKICQEIKNADKADLPELQADRESILDELYEVTADRMVRQYAPTGGLDLVRVARAFGPNLPKDWDEEIK